MDTKRVMNDFLVNAFNIIMKEEEYCISKVFNNLSVKEMHVIDAIANAVNNANDNRVTAIASVLQVTPGTLTTAVTQLEKKGYVQRVRCDKDRRVVRLEVTDIGKKAYEFHKMFHIKMVEQVLSVLSDEEATVLAKGLESVAEFFRRK